MFEGEENHEAKEERIEVDFEAYKAKVYSLTVPLKLIVLRGSVPPSWIKDWANLWRPELVGRVSVVNSPREVVGAVLKYMGTSYNTTYMDSQVAGGRIAMEK